MNATITFEPASQNLELTLLIMNDEIVEDDETFVLTLRSTLSGVTVGTGDMGLFGTTRIIIVDDDCKFVKR